MDEQKQVSPFELQQIHALAAADAWHFFEDSLVALRLELLCTRQLLDAGYTASDHIAIAGSFDNLKEGQHYMIEWRQTVDAWREQRTSAKSPATAGVVYGNLSA